MIRGWLAARLPGPVLARVDERMAAVESGAPVSAFFIAFSGIARDTGKDDLKLSRDELARANLSVSGWRPVLWSTDQAARALIVLTLAREQPEIFASTLETLWDAADMGEQIALYGMLPLFPDPARFEPRAAEGLRTNIAPVFQAVAHYSPFPREHFSEERWNQMILKALFIGLPLGPIHGLDERNNPQLAEMLVDYAAERSAAGRSVPEDLLRLLDAFPEERARVNRS